MVDTKSETIVYRRAQKQIPPSKRPRTSTTCSRDKILWSISDTADIWSVESYAEISVQTSFGTLLYKLRNGYRTDFRSGSSFINPVIPKIGNQKIALCWVIHDINYHGYISRSWADELLRDMLIEAGMPEWKANATYASVRLFGWSHYNHLEDNQGAIYNANRDHFIGFEWRP